MQKTDGQKTDGQKTDSQEYLDKKRLYSQLLTIYGRKPVLEALSASDVKPFRLHLSESNKPAEILTEITALARARGAEIIVHSKEELARISKNKKQDQGVAVDLKMPHFVSLEDFVKDAPAQFEIIALDRVTNPQNVGMIVRSVAASPLSALLLPQNGCAKLDSLVIKASAGALFKATIIRCNSLASALPPLKTLGAQVVGLDAASSRSFRQLPARSCVFILGNESDGLSPEVEKLCDYSVKIPMENGVESLNVAVTASLIAFRSVM